MKYYLFTLILACMGTIAHTRTLEVGPASPYASIKAALSEAVEDDLILIKGGVYKEGQIIVDKCLTIRGVNWPVLDGEGETEILTIMADGVTVEGLEIRNVGTDYLVDRAGIRVKKARDFTIRNNRLLDTFFGIYLEHASQGEVTGNEIIGNAVEEMSSGNAIHLWYCKKVLVENNRVSHHRDGIYFEFVDNSLIRYNVSEDNLRYGLHFMFSNEDDYFRNEFRRNGAGVAVMFSKKINMWENVFENNWGKASFGLLLKEIYDAEIQHNVFRENTVGIFVEGSTRVNYLQNDFLRNGWAIKISGGCLDNRVNGNNFISNTFDLSINTGRDNGNVFDGNYWSDYNGYDLDRDGIGDVPYRPVKLFNYVVNETPEAMVLLRSLFVDIINFSEKVSPVFTPENIVDNRPAMKRFQAERPDEDSLPSGNLAGPRNAMKDKEAKF